MLGSWEDVHTVRMEGGLDWQMEGYYEDEDDYDCHYEEDDDEGEDDVDDDCDPDYNEE